MLDLTKLVKQIPGISQHLKGEALASRQRWEQAQKLLLETKTRQDDLIQSHQQWRDRISKPDSDAIAQCLRKMWVMHRSFGFSL